MLADAGMETEMPPEVVAVTTNVQVLDGAEPLTFVTDADAPLESTSDMEELEKPYTALENVTVKVTAAALV